jgi:hypothetical protein
MKASVSPIATGSKKKEADISVNKLGGFSNWIVIVMCGILVLF